MTSNTPANRIVDQLVNLGELHADGALTDEEFKSLKARLISQVEKNVNKKGRRGSVGTNMPTEQSPEMTHADGVASDLAYNCWRTWIVGSLIILYLPMIEYDISYHTFSTLGIFAG